MLLPTDSSPHPHSVGRRLSRPFHRVLALEPTTPSIDKAMAKKPDAPYNTLVRSEKFIYALLVVALCYGQFVSNVHAIGHLHSHSSSDNYVIALSTCAPADFQLCSAALASEHNNEDKDCTIYHVLLNLTGHLWAGTTEIGTPLGSNTRIQLINPYAPLQ